MVPYPLMATLIIQSYIAPEWKKLCVFIRRILLTVKTEAGAEYE
jgi:hypothetical protein